MSSYRNLVTTEVRGTSYGTFFNDLALIDDIDNAAISRIIVGHAAYITSLTVCYEGQKMLQRRGGAGGTVDKVILEPGEFITKIEGSSWSEEGYMSRLTFFSNKERKWGPYGKHLGTLNFTWNATTMVSAELAPYMGLLYFNGSAESDIGHLQATFAKYPGPTSKPHSAVRYEEKTRDDHNPQSAITVSTFARSLMSPVVMLVVGEERTEFRAYEDILCRLPFFRAALLNGFKETTDKKITMPEDEPEIIAALLEFLYVGHYTYTFERDGIKPNSTPPCDLLEGSFHLRLYAAAFKYDCPGLVEAALKSVVYVLTHLDGIDVVILLKESYDRGCDTALWDAGEDMVSFKTKLPGILNRVFVTHSKGMKDIVFECPALSFDLLRLSVLAQ